MAGGAIDAVTPVCRSVRKFACHRGNGARLEGRSAEAATPDADSFRAAGLTDRNRMERGGEGRVHVRFDDREVMARNEGEDVRGDRRNAAIVEMQ